ncbi:Multidrug and toxin extrusion protein 1 [Larimichthys crocea]|uniref:Multidrug and toxin extrusion protein 1 n=1 Tax=Larimichthys crocea TaxID=215358 RepID=A0A6G0IIA3_LARCR|nr:Multidrug and toxin extrusion protein 1 [Larimichthys crocea]
MPALPAAFMYQLQGKVSAEPGWSLDCLQEWGLFTQVAIPSMLMLCLEWWTFEIGGFLAGVISKVELGAQSVVYQMVTIAFTFPMGLGAAASVRVGNALGAGNAEQAYNIWKDLHHLCLEIVQRVADAMIIYAFFYPADAMAGVTGGIIRGTGKPRIGAICNVVGYYCIGIPIGLSLMFTAKMGIVEHACSESQISVISSSILNHEAWTTDLQVLCPGRDQKADTAVPRPLLVRQLVLRRGLTVLVMVFILIVGILTRKMLLRLLK